MTTLQPQGGDPDTNAGGIGIKYLPWQITLFLIALILPIEASFHIGPLRLTPYRVVLLFAIIPCYRRVFSGKAGQVIATDKLLIYFSLWMILALSINHGILVGLQSGGILMLESLGTYLLARTFIRTEEQFCSLVKLLILLIIGISFFTIPEAITGINLLRPHAGHISGRLGLTRAFGSFDHPILYGCFCASTISLAFFVSTKKHLTRSSHTIRSLWMTVTTFMSVSSGPIAAVTVQYILAAWEKITRSIPGRWGIFSFILVIMYIAIDLFSNRTPMKVILSYLTFSPTTAYGRLLIWEWGIYHNVVDHPLFGIGFDDWVRLSWMSPSMDNFWLVNMVQFGLPAFIFLAAGILQLLSKVGKQTFSSMTMQSIKKGWLFSLIGLIIAGCTVHFWNSLYAWFFFLLGSGVWIISPCEPKTTLLIVRPE
ncbi:MAG: hypothetical protein J0665_04460 [Deltaproteobacteria bacterium]|nr:hypothetical protein [Deltaproteobacteria bacterium]